ncbi:MAG: SIS domain-containing protein [Acidobacteria bacterium]|nr:SIS domain-containing protein [Acidobacteriota bacterium]
MLRTVAEHQALVSRFFDTAAGALDRAADALVETVRAGGKILWFGNGGSAADAQHFAGELVGGMGQGRSGLAAIALTTDTSVLTSLANDFDFPSVFARQIRALGRPGDAAVGISTSGRSENVRNGLLEARRCGLRTLALLGRDGGSIRPVADLVLVVPGENTQRIQEVHLVIGHLLCERILEAVRPAPEDPA